MTIVSFQGIQLTAGQRRRLELEKKARASFMSPVLAGQLEKALQAVEIRKEQGTKPERIWFQERLEKGTPSFAEWMGYGQTEL